MPNQILVLPAFEPSPQLPNLVRALSDAFAAVVVVDDGSRRSAAVFAETAALPGVRLLRHATNRGKGAALKTAFAEILRAFPDTTGVVTADADGQHLPADIRRVAAASAAHPDCVTLGVRSFGGRDVPFRSRLGNLWTCGEFLLLTGTWIRDTQTGLRGIPRALLPRFAALAGDRYDYEARMLVAAAKLPQPPVQIPITTVYENGNGTSHYRPLADTLSTQAALLRAAFVSRRDAAGAAGRTPRSRLCRATGGASSAHGFS